MIRAVTVGAITLVGAGLYSLGVMEKQNQEIYIERLDALETNARNIPQTDEGEDVSFALGQDTEALRTWERRSWITRAFIEPPQPIFSIPE